MSNKPEKLTTLFLDLGGVLLTDGWNRIARKKAAVHFELDHDLMEDRHHITVENNNPVSIIWIGHN